MSQNHRFGNVEVRPAERALLIDGKLVDVGSRAFDLLEALIAQRDRVVPKDELLDIVWPGLVVEENNLQVQISALRKLLGPRAIATIPGRGYQFSLEEAAPNPLSIVVLPFANQTGDAQKAYVADALTTSITSDLARIRDAFVIAATTAFNYKDRPASVQQIGKELCVHFALQGSVLTSGKNIRISAQLVDTQSGAQLWSETFGGQLTNLFALLDQVTGRIGNSIGREMVIVAARESETRKSNPRTADLMLRASALHLKPQTLKHYQQIEALYRQALLLEPNNANALVGLARSLVLQAFNYGSAFDEGVRETKYVEAHELALKAKDLDTENPDVYQPIFVYALAHDDFSGSRRAAEAQLSLDSKNPNAYNSLALSFLYGGEPQRAIELLTQAINLLPNPRFPALNIMRNIGRAHFMLGEYDAAIEWYLKALEINPEMSSTYVYLAMAHSLKGDTAKARAAVANVCRLDPGFRLSEWDKPQSSSPPTYREWFEKKYLPAARNAGLPE